MKTSLLEGALRGPRSIHRPGRPSGRVVSRRNPDNNTQ